MKDAKRVLIRKSAVALAVLGIAGSACAEVTEAQIEALQQQILELKQALQQQKAATATAAPVVLAPAATNVPETASTPVAAKPQSSISLPHFTTQNGTEFQIYGNIRADASYQIKGPNAMYNYISTVPLKGSDAEHHNSDKFQSTLNATRFGLNMSSKTQGGHKLGGKLEMDFFGGAGRDTFRIRHAYITFDDWLVGQTWSNFNAVEYFPETVDASLSVGGSLTRVAQVKYSHPIDQNLNFAVSLEDPKPETVTTSGTQDLKTDPNAKLKMPSAVGRLNYKFDNGSALSGRVFLTQKATTEGHGDDFLAWGAALGGKYQITDNTLLRFDYNHIKGDTKNLLWSNYAYVFDEHGNMKPNEFDAVTAGITQQITPKIRSTLGFGYMKADTGSDFAKMMRNSKDDIANLQNKELVQGWINAFYQPAKPINIGIEYIYGERKTFNDQKGIDNRINTTIIYDF